MVRKGGFEPPRLSAPPPQDGVSASSTTSARGTSCNSSRRDIIAKRLHPPVPPGVCYDNHRVMSQKDESPSGAVEREKSSSPGLLRRRAEQPWRAMCRRSGVRPRRKYRGSPWLEWHHELGQFPDYAENSRCLERCGAAHLNAVELSCPATRVSGD
jgi:hypothetical protein